MDEEVSKALVGKIRAEIRQVRFAVVTHGSAENTILIAQEAVIEGGFWVDSGRKIALVATSHALDELRVPQETAEILLDRFAAELNLLPPVSFLKYTKRSDGWTTIILQLFHNREIMLFPGVALAPRFLIVNRASLMSLRFPIKEFIEILT